MKKIINSLLNLLGYKIKAVHSPLQSFGEGVEQIAARFEIDAVIDVGVAHHTNDLYKPFSDKKILLIEANPAFAPNLKLIQERYDAIVEMVFCGKESGEVSITIPENHRRTTAYSVDSHITEKVRVETLDELTKRNSFDYKNILLKIDVEGSEKDVLQGGPRTLSNASVVILEICWGVAFASGAADYSELITFMKEADFELYNIVEGGGILRKGRLTHADFIFVNKQKLGNE